MFTGVGNHYGHIWQDNLIKHNVIKEVFSYFYRNSESKQNYVDRVRLPDSSYIFGGPGRGSGWRQRSLSNIDLTSQTRHSFTKQSRDYSSGLYDLYSRIESRKDYQNVYKFSNHSVNNNSKCFYCTIFLKLNIVINNFLSPRTFRRDLWSSKTWYSNWSRCM